MKFKGDINGVISDSETMTFKPSKLYVQYTSDKIGKSLSIGDPETGISYQIPFDGLIKIILRGEK